MNAGLLGPILITRKGASRPDGTPKDVDREFVVAFAVFDETESWYFEASAMNQRQYAPICAGPEANGSRLPPALSLLFVERAR